MSDAEPDFVHTKYGWCYFEIAKDKGQANIYGLQVVDGHRKMGHAGFVLRTAIGLVRHLGYLGEISVRAEPVGDSIPLEKLMGFYEGLGLNVEQDE